MDITLREARPQDLDDLARVCYLAFRDIAERHGFPPDFTGEDAARLAYSSFLAHPMSYGVVAEREGRVVGSAFAHDRHPVAAIGPVTVDPSVQNEGVGRRMMEAIMEWAQRGGFPSVRLVQSAYHTRSLALYASLGFDVREPLSCLQGPAIAQTLPGHRVRTAIATDIPACNELCRMVHGLARSFELARGVEREAAMVVERDGRVTGYASELAFWGHAVAETDQDLEALIAAAPDFGGPGFLVPTRNTGVLRWGLSHGLRIVQPMTLMTTGWYQEPNGAYLPSVGF